MSHNSIVTGTIAPVFGLIGPTIPKFRKAIQEKDVWNRAFTFHGQETAEPGRIDVFLEFPDRDMQKASDELKVILEYFAGFAAEQHIVYAGAMSIASYNDEDPDDEQIATCSLSSRAVRFSASENDSLLVSTSSEKTPSATPKPPAPTVGEVRLRQKYKEIWDEAYAQGIEDQKTSDAMAGVAGCYCRHAVCVCTIPPARVNPYA